MIRGGVGSPISVSAVVRGLVEPRTWREALYALVSLPLSLAGSAFVLVTLALGIVTSVTFVGLPVLAAGGLGARRLGSVQRQLAARLLDEQVVPPPLVAGGTGFLGTVQAALRDKPAWRARAYLVVKLPLAVATALVLALWATSPYSLLFQLSTGGFGVALMSLAVLFAGPWALRGAVWLDRRLVAALLGMPAGEARLVELREARSRIASDSAARLRRIERDLHDGTQAQLSAVAMKLGQAKEKLEHRDGVPYDPDGALSLIDSTHRHAKDALVELREIVRGIHPPALDLGLEPALQTLASRSTVPVTLSMQLRTRPSQAIETVAYFSATELIANAVRHSRAGRIELSVSEQRGRLRMEVRDDGVGGAAPGGGTGLAGLKSRLEAVDGHLEIDSPSGGPTLIRIDLPLSA